MAFNLTLYTTADDPRKVTKTLTQITTVSINPTGSIDILNPVFIINYNASYLAANYCYCAALSRYYFIDDMSLEIGKQIKIQASVDVLMTYDAQIRECTASIIRSESVGHPTYIQDQKLPVHPTKRDYKILAFNPESPYPLDIDTSHDVGYLIEVI